MPLVPCCISHISAYIARYQISIEQRVAVLVYRLVSQRLPYRSKSDFTTHSLRYLSSERRRKTRYSCTRVHKEYIKIQFNCFNSTVISTKVQILTQKGEMLTRKAWGLVIMTYADECCCMWTYADVCLLTYADVWRKY